ncbi:MAG: hypothetical protein ABWX92_00910, partial [Mycetocola sp.]
MSRKLLARAGAAVVIGTLILLVTAGVVASLSATARPQNANLTTSTTAPDAPEETPSPTPTPTDTGELPPAPTNTAVPEPTPSESATPAPAPRPTSSPTPTATETPAPAIPPAVTTSTIPLPTLLIAIGVLVAGGFIVWSVMRKRPPPVQAAPESAHPEMLPAPVVLDSMAALGTAMIDSGYPVGIVRDALEDLAAASGRPTIQAVIFPTSLLVSSSDSSVAQTRAVLAGDSSYLLYQVDM